MGSLIILAAMFALLWVLLIRPQRARQQQQRNMLSSISPGDEVLTVGGIYGIVQELDEEDDLIVEIAEGIQVRVARRAVGAVVKPTRTTTRNELDDEDAERTRRTPTRPLHPWTSSRQATRPSTRSPRPRRSRKRRSSRRSPRMKVPL